MRKKNNQEYITQSGTCFQLPRTDPTFGYICDYDFQGDDCPWHYKCLDGETCEFLRPVRADD